MRDKENAQKRFSPLSITFALLLFVAIGAAAAYAIQMMNAKAPVELVVLKADQDDFKTKAEVIETDKSAENNSTVFTLLDELSSAKDEVEVLNLEPSSPELPEVKIEEPANDKPVNEDAVNEEPQEADDKANEAETTDIAALDEQDNKASDTASEAEQADKAAPTSRPAAPRIVKKDIVKDGPSMMVQLAAFRNQEKAQEIASLLTKKHSERLQGLSLGVMQIDTGSSGIFWRVITEALPNEDARALCDSLKRAGQDCILRKATIQ